MVYVLSETASAIRWSDWRKMGGCSLSIQAEKPIRNHYYSKRQRFELQNPSLKDIGKISRLAELEIARYAVEHLKRDDLVAPEAAE